MPPKRFEGKFGIPPSHPVESLHTSKTYLETVFERIDQFLSSSLLLTTHKVEIQSLYRGVDVLGEVFFPQYTRLRRNTERRKLLREIRDGLRR